MAVYPRAKYRPVVGLEKDPPIIPVGVILHVAATNADSLYGYFNGPSGGIESHLHIPLTSKAPVEQYRDTTREADANYKGNSWIGADGRRYGFLSIETAGLADGEWNQHQLDEILAFIRWAHSVHGFPLRKAPGYRSPGLGYHVMFGTGEGTNSWSNARGKVCPGPRRIRQFEEIILPALMEPAKPATPATAPAPGGVLAEPAGAIAYHGPAGAPDGYWIFAADGGVFAKGAAPYRGSLPELGVKPAAPVVDGAASADGDGYFLLGEDGGVFRFPTDAKGFGSLAGKLPAGRKAKRILVDPADVGLLVLLDDGAIHGLGHPRFWGSVFG